tara:strand:- start:315 stop:1058 length:744 start_codon:yes stop_codon:yes gene_type:complete
MEDKDQSVQENQKITYLKSDDTIRNQNFVCLSFITPELIKNCKVRGVKVRGVYASEEEAKRRCEELNKIDPDFNIYIAPVGCWLPWCDDPDKAEDCEYANEELNKLMKAYKENQVKAKMLHENRKQELIEKNIRESEERKKKNEKEKEKENEVESNEVKSNEVESNEVESNEVESNEKIIELDNNVTLEEIQKIEASIENNKQKLSKKEDLLNKQTKELNESEKMKQHIHDELTKAKELFEKMKNKD